MRLLLVILLALAAQSYAKLEFNFTSNAGVKIYNPSSFFNTTGPWSLMSQAGDSLYIAGAFRRGAGSIALFGHSTTAYTCSLQS